MGSTYVRFPTVPLKLNDKTMAKQRILARSNCLLQQVIVKHHFGLYTATQGNVRRGMLHAG
jgi:hypothetical protein